MQKLVKLEQIPQEVEGQQIEVDQQWPNMGQITFEHIQLRYRPNTEIILDKLCFAIGSCKKIGICGRTGAGKSTIALTLSRIVELESGTILIDGVDISKVNLRTLRNKITVIPQDPTLFRGSLRFNLDPFN